MMRREAGHDGDGAGGQVGGCGCLFGVPRVACSGRPQPQICGQTVTACRMSGGCGGLRCRVMRTPPPAPVLAALGTLTAGAVVWCGYWLLTGRGSGSAVPLLLAAVIAWSMWRGGRAGLTTVVGFAALLSFGGVVYLLRGISVPAATMLVLWQLLLVGLCAIPASSREWFSGGRWYI